MKVRITNIAFDVFEEDILEEDGMDLEEFIEETESEYIDEIVELNSDGSDELEIEKELVEYIEESAGLPVRDLSYEIV